MSENNIYPVSSEVAKKSLLNNDQYLSDYAESIADPDKFWSEKGKILDWITPYTKVKNTSYAPGQVDIKWFEDGELNVSVNCIDRHLATRADQVALIWEGDSPDQDANITFQMLYTQVCQFANALKSLGIKKGDVVCLYMPMTPEAAVAMLACTRIGAVHSIVFGGFSPDAIAGRVIDSNAKLVITADEGRRGGRTVPLKGNVDEALTRDGTNCVEHVIVFKNTGADINWQAGRDIDWKEITESQASDCTPEVMNAEDPLFILYTSGSTGTPKGVLHTTGGYLVYAAMTFKYVFDYQEGDIYWCTADVGWITGHSYLVYGPLANGATTLLFEGVPNYPTASRMSEVVDKHNVTLLYTAPTAI